MKTPRAQCNTSVPPAWLVKLVRPCSPHWRETDGGDFQVHFQDDEPIITLDWILQPSGMFSEL